MPDWAAVALVIAAIVGAVPGVLAWKRQSNVDRAAAKEAAREARRRGDETAVEGFARLADELRGELERRESDCEGRIKRIVDDYEERMKRLVANYEERMKDIKRDLLEKIVELESQMQEAKAGG